MEWFRHSAPYVHAHRDRTFVLVFGGQTVASEGFRRLVSDVALLAGVGVKLVVVHGAQPQTEARMQVLGAKVRRVRGRQIFDARALLALKEAAGAMRVEIEALFSMGVEDSPMGGARIRVASGNLVMARPVGVRDGTDYRYSGEVRRIDVDSIRRHLDRDDLVLLPPLGYSPTGEVFHLMPEDVACAAATALQADKLVCLVDGGVRDRRRRLVQQLTPKEADAVLASGPRQTDSVERCLRAAVRACRFGVRRAHLIDRALDGGLLLELFTREGAGTLVTDETFEGIRPARLQDVPGILRLIQPLEEEGLLVKRSPERLETELDRFTVVERDGSIIGCAALDPYPQEKVGELACVAVHSDYRRTGRGDALLDAMEKKARDQGLGKIFVLTTRTPHWFEERGFVPSRPAALPPLRRQTYDRKRRSRVLMKTL